jgi:NAD+ dependent glucose-6-phosphate dehydrogenase
MRTVLIVGASGEIGTQLAERLADRYTLTLADRSPPRSGVPSLQFDIADLDAYTAACAGIDTVVHLAGERRMDATWEELLPANIVGAYHAFEAARRAGCRRVVFASSVHTNSGEPDDVMLRADAPTRPGNLYGATKVWGEAVARVYADQRGLSTLCLRIGWAGHRDDQRRLAVAQAAGVYLTYEDAAGVFSACIDAPDDLHFGIYYATSANRYPRVDLTDTREVLRYLPHDDAFTLRDAPVDDRPRSGDAPAD